MNIKLALLKFITGSYSFCNGKSPGPSIVSMSAFRLNSFGTWIRNPNILHFIYKLPDNLTNVILSYKLQNDSEQTRVVLTSAAYVHLKQADFSKYTRNLSPASRAILLSGPTGTLLSNKIQYQVKWWMCTRFEQYELWSQNWKDQDYKIIVHCSYN